jgi:hypothetical protein
MYHIRRQREVAFTPCGPQLPNAPIDRCAKQRGESFAHLSGSSGKVVMAAYRHLTNDQKSKIDASTLPNVQNSKFNIQAAIEARFSRNWPLKAHIFQPFPP